ncbi:MAG: ABC transporter permease subunit [Ilumatobacteraceae bacterium]
MSVESTTSTAPSSRDVSPPWWRDVTVLAWVFQFAVLAIVLAIVAWLVNNVRVNSSEQNIPTGFAFLDQPAGFEIPGNSFRQSQSVSAAIYQGFLNTLRVALAGIVLATILGVAVGVGRLTTNWVVRTICKVYVEVLRNIPLPGIVSFVYLGVVLAMPRTQDSWKLGPLVVANVRGVSVPWVTGSFLRFVLVLLAASAATYAVRRWRLAVNARTGEPAKVGWWAVPVFVLVAFWGAVLVGNGVTTPELEGRLTTGGMTFQPEYFALLVSLVIYTASHIAEIVRGSIQAVPKGQVEAAGALALGSWQRLRFVVLPQAFRIALPAFGNQYLNLMKNSSLGFLISYFDLTKVVSTSIGNRSPAVPAYLLLMVIYLAISLTIAGVVNFTNRRLQLVTR